MDDLYDRYMNHGGTEFVRKVLEEKEVKPKKKRKKVAKQMVFNPNSRESCEYYGVPYKERERSVPDYYPDQSRDYALANTVRCACTSCGVNKNGYCEVPSLIEITSGGNCATGQKFIKARK